MESLGLVGVFGLMAAFITAIVELIKAWIPLKYKDKNGLKFTWKKKKVIHLPNQAVWPLLSLAIGIGMFLLLEYSYFGDLITNQTGSAAISGGVSSLCSNGIYRIKNVLGGITGGNEETDAQNTGPLSMSVDQVTENNLCGPTVEDIPCPPTTESKQA